MGCGMSHGSRLGPMASQRLCPSARRPVLCGIKSQRCGWRGGAAGAMTTPLRRRGFPLGGGRATDIGGVVGAARFVVGSRRFQRRSLGSGFGRAATPVAQGAEGGALRPATFRRFETRGSMGIGWGGRFRLTGWAARLWPTLSMLAAAVMLAPAALAEEAQDWQLGMQPGVTPVRDHIDFLHDDILLPIIAVITVFVLGLLLYTIVRFNARRHPTPSQTTHNTLIEVTWTTVPILILLVILVPSMKLLYFNDRTQHADMTLKVTGHQWYWSYEYPDQGDISFDSTMIPEEEQVKRGLPRLLEVDNPVVVPVGATVRILVSGTDVIHSWFVPAAGV